MDEQVHPHTTKTPPAIAGVVLIGVQISLISFF
jgi:hypothetical protein